MKVNFINKQNLFENHIEEKDSNKFDTNFKKIALIRIGLTTRKYVMPHRYNSQQKQKVYSLRIKPAAFEFW